MKSILSIFIVLLYFLAGTWMGFGQVLTLEDHYFFINGQKTFLKGIGYEAGAIPGQYPWDRVFDEELLEFDMQRIQSGGFNCIRTWDALTNQELEVIGRYPIYIIMGIWIDPHGDFSDETFRTNARNYVNSVLSYTKNHDFILGYLIHNEPLPEAIFSAVYDLDNRPFNKEPCFPNYSKNESI